MFYSAVYTLLFALLFTLATACGFVTETPQPETTCFPTCTIDQTCTLSEDRMTARCIDTFTGGGPLQGIESCQWLAECIDECERQELDSKCADACEEQAAEDVQKVQSTWRACVHTNCNAIRSSECLRQWCAPQTTRCFGELPGDALTMGPMTCEEVAKCDDSCQNDPDCTADCLVHGTREAQRNWTAIVDCAHEQCHTPTTNGETDGETYLECAQTHCPAPWATCFGPGPNPPEGTESCGEIHRCTMSCADSVCLQNCNARGTFEARSIYKDFFECTLNRCNPMKKKELDPAMCFPMMCGAVMDRCFDERLKQ